MTFKRFKEYKLVKFITNRYVIILVVFSVWMLFFDENSYLVHRKFNTEIEKLETNHLRLRIQHQRHGERAAGRPQRRAGKDPHQDGSFSRQKTWRGGDVQLRVRQPESFRPDPAATAHPCCRVT